VLPGCSAVQTCLIFPGLVRTTNSLFLTHQVKCTRVYSHHWRVSCDFCHRPSPLLRPRVLSSRIKEQLGPPPAHQTEWAALGPLDREAKPKVPKNEHGSALGNFSVGKPRESLWIMLANTEKHPPPPRKSLISACFSN
jgi:hypothetical protein